MSVTNEVATKRLHLATMKNDRPYVIALTDVHLQVLTACYATRDVEPWKVLLLNFVEFGKLLKKSFVELIICTRLKIEKHLITAISRCAVMSVLREKISECVSRVSKC